MKTLSINSVNWIKTFFMAAVTAKSKPVLYHRTTAANNKRIVNGQEQTATENETKPSLGDLMRTAHRGNFSAGPNFLFHPGWFK